MSDPIHIRVVKDGAKGLAGYPVGHVCEGFDPTGAAVLIANGFAEDVTEEWEARKADSRARREAKANAKAAPTPEQEWIG